MGNKLTKRSSQHAKTSKRNKKKLKAEACAASKTTQQPVEANTASKDVQQPAETSAASKDVQQSAEANTASKDVQQPAEASAASKNVQQSAEASTASKDVQQPAEVCETTRAQELTATCREQKVNPTLEECGAMVKARPAPTRSDSVDDSTLRYLSKQVGKEWRDLGTQLGFTPAEIEVIEVNKYVYGIEEMAFEVMNKWKRKCEATPTLKILAKKFERIQRMDIVRKIERICLQAEREASGHPTLENKMAENYKGSLFLSQIQTKLKDEYRRFKLQGLPWMEDIEITLAEYYVMLSMLQQDKKGVDLPEKSVKIDKLFEVQDVGKKPSRILIEGGPGYGKTTFGCKLCYDYATTQEYISKYDLVILLPLRYFTGDLKELLKRGSRTCEEYFDDIFNIMSDKGMNICLILDGFDEVPKQYIPSLLQLIRGDTFSHLTVVVTSRPGHFTSQKGRPEGFQISSDNSIAEKPFDSRIKIIGIDQSLLTEFVSKHTVNLSESAQLTVFRQLEILMENQIVTENFLQCPLFLLMVILLLIESENSAILHLKTKTGLYQEVMNFVLRRYATKCGSDSADSIDLFSLNSTQACFYTDLMIQFGQFAFEAITTYKLSFTADDIFGGDKCRDKRIADIGLFTSNVTVKGFRTKLCYEPVHRSLLEFTAAYFLRVEFKRGNRSEWVGNVWKVRPTSSNSSLVFPFLSGLMENDAYVLYKILTPFKAEYSSDFDPLESSLTEVQMTETFLSSILPLIPTNLIVHRADTYFFTTRLSKIFMWGLTKEKIKLLELNATFSICFSENVAVEKLVLYIEDTVFPLSESQPINLRCKDLYCCFNSSNPTSNTWAMFLLLISSIKFHRVSFDFRYLCPFFLPLFCSAVTTGPLRDANIRYVIIRYGTQNVCRLNHITELIQKERIKGLWLDLGKSLDSIMSTFMCKEDCQGCDSLMQQYMDNAVAYVAKSSRLKYFVVRNFSVHDLTIDMPTLCNNGSKAWKWVRSDNVGIKCTQEIPITCCEIQQYAAWNYDLPQSLCSVFQSCQITALNSNFPFMEYNAHLRVCNDHVTEVHVQLDESVYHQKFFPCLSHLPNLKRLGLEMYPFDHRCFPFSVEEWLLMVTHFTFNLRGIEIHTVEVNRDLALELAQAIAKSMEVTNVESPPSELSELPSSSTPAQPKRLKLNYVMLKTELNPDHKTLSLPDSENIIYFFCTVSAFQESVRKCLLPQLDVVTKSSKLYLCMSTLRSEPFSIYYIFPPIVGFRVECSDWGTKKDDSIQSKHYRKFQPYSFTRYSITFNEDAEF